MNLEKEKSNDNKCAVLASFRLHTAIRTYQFCIPTSAVVYVTLKNDGHSRLTESLEGNLKRNKPLLLNKWIKNTEEDEFSSYLNFLFEC